MTALRCKVGDVAIVVSAEQAPNLGQLVEVLGPQTGEPFHFECSGHVWRVRALTGRPTLTYLLRSPERFVHHTEGPVPDARLRPLPGLPAGCADSDSVSVPKVRTRRRKQSSIAVRPKPALVDG